MSFDDLISQLQVENYTHTEHCLEVFVSNKSLRNSGCNEAIASIASLVCALHHGE